MYVKVEERNGRIDFVYNPIDHSSRDISVLTTLNLHDNLPKSIRRYGNFQYVLQEKALFHFAT